MDTKKNKFIQALISYLETTDVDGLGEELFSAGVDKDTISLYFKNTCIYRVIIAEYYEQEERGVTND